MAVGVKLLHIVSDNNLINVVQRFVLSPFRTLRPRKCSGFSKFFSYSENGSSANPINDVQRFVLSPFRTLRRRKCSGFSKIFSYSENGSSANPSCLNMMSYPALSVSQNSLKR